MRPIDITIAITAHSETVIAGPTLRSAEAAIQGVEREGITVERLIGFDTPTKDCISYMSQPDFSKWEISEYAFRDQGKTRNALAARARGRWLAFLDGDDLFSENWLLEAVRLLEHADIAGDRIIVHPEINWVFDAGQFVFTKPMQSDSLFTPYYFGVANYYDALCVALREAWLENPYADRAVSAGFAYEDWQWGVETMSAGWRHVVAKDTIIFKRRRDASQTLQARDNSVCIRAISSLAIDRIMMLGKP